MKIGFDSHALRPPLTGIGVYCWNVLSALREMDSHSEYIFYSYYLRGEKINPPSHPNNNIQSLKRIPWMPLQKFWMTFGFPAADKWFGDFDIVHGLFNFIPPTRKAKKVVTIYDLAFLKFPERFKASHAKHFAEITKFSCHNANAIITISENTKQDIIEEYRIPEERIIVAYPGFKKQLFHSKYDRAVLEEARIRLGLGKRIILYLGTLEPRKNLDVLLDAFLKIDQKNKNEFQLVLAGKQGDGMEAFVNRLKPLIEQKKVIRLGFVSEQDSALLYNLSEVFAYPSLYEGFGIPPLEAMACGCPVVTSAVSSLPEVVGDAGLLIQPKSVEELSSALSQVLDNATFRNELVQKGFAQAQTFTWERPARQTLDLYKSLCSI